MKLDGDKVREARLSLGYTLEVLGQEAGIAKRSALRAEHGQEITPSTARKVAQALGVKVADLRPLAQAPLFSQTPEERRIKEQRWEWKWANLMRIAEHVQANPHLYDAAAAADEMIRAAQEDLEEERKREAG